MVHTVLLLGLPAAQEQFFCGALAPFYVCRAAHTLRSARQQAQLYAPCLVFVWAPAFAPGGQTETLGIPAVYLGKDLLPPYTLPRILQTVQRFAAPGAAGGTVCRVNGWQIDLAARTAQKENTHLYLTPQQAAALLCLAQAQGQSVSHAALKHAIWGTDAPDNAALRREIAALRQLLGQQAVRTCPGVGYALGEGI